MTKQQIIYSACIVSIIGGITIGVTFLTLYGMRTRHGNRTLVTQYDTYIAPSLQKNLQDVLHGLLNTDTSDERIFETLKKNAPALARMTFDYRIPGYLKIHLTCDSPLCGIKQEYQPPRIVSREGFYAPAQHYTSDLITGIPSVMVTEKNLSPHSEQALYVWIKNLPTHFFNRYQACWNHPNDIKIFDQEHTNFEYITAHTIPFTSDMEQKLTRLHELHAQQKNKVKIDMRFKDQLILVPIIQKRGVS